MVAQENVVNAGCSPQVSIISSNATTLTSNIPTSDDNDDYVWLSDRSLVDLSQSPPSTVVKENAEPLISNDGCKSQLKIMSESPPSMITTSNEIIDNLADDSELVLLRKELSQIISRTQKFRRISMLKYVDCLMSAIEGVVNTSFEKSKLFNCLHNAVREQFGLSYVKDFFLSHGSADRDNLIFELQMLQSFYFAKANRVSVPNTTAEISSTKLNKRKLPTEYEDNSGDEVTYIDKPGVLL
jgi:hypothetical protein